MRVISTHMRAVTLGFIAIVALALAACGGNGDSPRAVDDTAAPADDERLVASQALLRSSAERLQDDITSMRGTFSMDMTTDGLSMSIGGDMLFRAPDDVYMTMSMFGEQMEMLMSGTDFYMNIPGEGWVYVDVEDLGFDRQMLEDLLDNRALIDLEMLGEIDEWIEELPDTTIDGESVHHLRMEPDWATIMEDAGSVLPSGIPIDLDGMEGNVVADIYVHTGSELPRRLVMTMDMSMFGETVTMVLTMDFLEYDGPVDIPEPPADARRASEIDIGI
jgi:hypothetical protein